MNTPATSSRVGRARRLKALIVKESLQVVRDPSSILIAFVLPLILLFLFGYGVSLDARQVRLGVVLEDSSPEARRLAASFQATPFFHARTALDRHHLESELVSSRLRGIVIVPQDFARSLHAPGTTAQVQLITDGSETNTANYVANYTAGTLAAWMAQEAALQRRAVEPMTE